MKNKYSILLVEDEENFGLVLKNYLELSNYLVTLCQNGKLGLNAFRKVHFDLCIFDVMMPEMDGFSLAGDIKKINNQTPIIFLTAKTQKHDIVKGYQLGADEYITKPFDTEVLLLKINAIINRSTKLKNQTKKFVFGMFEFNAITRELNSTKGVQKLSPKEAKLLELLCQNKNEVVPRDLALNEIWNDNSYFATRSMDVFIAKLRKYLKEDSSVEIINVHGNGFRLWENDL